jgi:hypothetical protein
LVLGRVVPLKVESGSEGAEDGRAARAGTEPREASRGRAALRRPAALAAAPTTPGPERHEPPPVGVFGRARRGLGNDGETMDPRYVAGVEEQARAAAR